MIIVKIAELLKSVARTVIIIKDLTVGKIGSPVVNKTAGTAVLSADITAVYIRGINLWTMICVVVIQGFYLLGGIAKCKEL